MRSKQFARRLQGWAEEAHWPALRAYADAWINKFRNSIWTDCRRRWQQLPGRLHRPELVMNCHELVSPSSCRQATSRVLVVDDITKNLQVVGTMLRNEGYEVMPATSGAAGLGMRAGAGAGPDPARPDDAGDGRAGSVPPAQGRSRRRSRSRSSS